MRTAKALRRRCSCRRHWRTGEGYVPSAPRSGRRFPLSVRSGADPSDQAPFLGKIVLPCDRRAKSPDHPPVLEIALACHTVRACLAPLTLELIDLAVAHG